MTSSSARRRDRLDGLADGGGHGEDAGIAPGDHADPGAIRGRLERRLGAVELFAIVGGDAVLVGAQRQAVEIGSVAEKQLRAGNGGGRLGRHLLGLAGAGSHDDEASAHGLVLQPGTSTMEK